MIDYNSTVSLKFVLIAYPAQGSESDQKWGEITLFFHLVLKKIVK